MKQLLFLILFLLGLNLPAQTAKHPIVIEKKNFFGKESAYVTTTKPDLNKLCFIDGKMRKVANCTVNYEKLRIAVDALKKKYFTPEQRKRLEDYPPLYSQIKLTCDGYGNVIYASLDFQPSNLVDMFSKTQLQKIYDALWNIKPSLSVFFPPYEMDYSQYTYAPQGKYFWYDVYISLTKWYQPKKVTFPINTDSIEATRKNQSIYLKRPRP